MTEETKVYQSVEDADADAATNSVSAATKAGFTEQVVDDGHILCQKPDSYELVDVFPDGSWEYQNVDDDGKAKSMSGADAVMLALYLHSDENKAMFEEHAKNQD